MAAPERATLMQVVVLAGGLGTRLRAAIPAGTPKPMAFVAGRPFLEHLLEQAVTCGASSFVLLVGHHATVIRDRIGNTFRGRPVLYSQETAQLGTGGAIAAARPMLEERFVLMNGDTYVPVDLQCLVSQLRQDALALTLVRMKDTTRFGAVHTEKGRATAMLEKGVGGPGLINAGVYAMRRELLETFPQTEVCSFERDVLEIRLPDNHAPFTLARGTFFDIGVPEDYRAADQWFQKRDEN